MFNKTILLTLILIFTTINILPAIILYIRQDGAGDFLTIQDGIDAAVEGDTVLVYPGTYYENIDFSGKNIVVSSLQLTTGDNSYIYNTIIDGGFAGDVVSITNNETLSAVLNGFTIQYGHWRGIGIRYSSPTLSNLVVRRNYGLGIILSGSYSYLENVTVTENHSVFYGGGIAIEGNSNITFSSENKCNIYNNTAGYAADIGIHPYQTVPVNVIVDTFTVLDPDWNFVTQSEYLTLSIDNQWLQQVESDLYVAPDGNDNNSGLTPEEPLKSIQWALTKINADNQNPRTIHLAPGIYSHASSGQLYPLNMRSYVTIQGAGKDLTFMEEEYAPGYPEVQSAIIFGTGVTDIGIKDMTFRNIQRNDLNTSHIIWIQEFYAPGISINVDISGIRIENCVMAGINKNASGDFRITDSDFINNSGNRMLFVYATFADPEDYGDAYLNNLVVIGHQPFMYYGEALNGGIAVMRVNNIHLSNSLIANNRIRGDDWGPFAFIALYPQDRLTFTNNIVAFNQTIGGIPCGAMFLGGVGTIDIKNSIFYGNTDYQFITFRNNVAPTQVNISHTLIEGGTQPSVLHIADSDPYGVNFNWGEGIIDTPPVFLGEVEGWDPNDKLFYQPSNLSPYIDAGTPDVTGLNIPPYDLLHNQRIWDGLGDGMAIIDIGCFEYNAPEYSSIEEYLILPETLWLTNYPNPFNPETTISFSLLNPGKIRLEIFNIRGQKITTLLDEYREAGEHRIVWNGRDEQDRSSPSGVYFYRLSGNNTSKSKKMLLLK